MEDWVIVYKNQTYLDYQIVPTAFADTPVGGSLLAVCSGVRLFFVAIVLSVLSILTIISFEKFIKKKSKMSSKSSRTDFSLFKYISI